VLQAPPILSFVVSLVKKQRPEFVRPYHPADLSQNEEGTQRDGRNDSERHDALQFIDAYFRNALRDRFAIPNSD
jgi:predicted ester cyclase